MPFFLVIFFMKEYKTVRLQSCDEFIEKKSRFIGYVKPVETQEQAVDFINKIKSKHWDATHNVSAYVLRSEMIKRFSDDGEPSGTAGMPMLDVLEKSGVVDVCVVGTRYFGGVMLGAGGLVRAYSHTAKIALDAGKIITMAPCNIYSASIDYSIYERFNLLLAQFGAEIKNTDFTDKISVTFAVRENKSEELAVSFCELCNGKYSLNKIGSEFAAANA